MATKKVNIDIVAKDKSKRALNTVRGSLDKLKSSVFNVKTALAGLGAGLVIRNLVNTGKELENLQVRFKFLLKNAEEGAKAFENMTKFASQVPFSLEEIQSGSGILATVTDNADDLQKMLEITGNVAATTGLDFRTAAEQIQRSFSAGIGAADLFREKGVRNMLGFKAGATVSIEETVEAFERVFGKGGQFGQATDELADTFEGTLSMIGDKFFNFKRRILEAGFFPELKKQFKSLDDFLANNTEAFDILAEKIGRGLAIAVKKVSDGFIILKDNANLVAGAFAAIVAVKLAGIFISVTTALAGLTLGMKAFNSATKKNIIFASVGVFATTFGLLIEKFREFKKELSDGTFETKHAGKSISELKSEISRLSDAIQFRLNSGITNFETILAKSGVPESGKSINMLQDEIRSLAEALQIATENQEKFGMATEQPLDKVKQLAMENSKAYADMKNSTGEALVQIEEENKRSFNRTLQNYRLFAFTMKQAQKNDQDAMLKDTQEYYDKFTEAMSLRYRMEQKLIRENNEELDAQLEKYTQAMLIRGRINDEAMSKDKTLFSSFKSGFREAMESGADAMTKMKDIGVKTFDELTKTLTDFVMTGKLNFQSLAKTIIRMLLEALIGSAIKSAIAKSEAMMLMSTIRRAMRNVFEGATRTFASIPFPFNIAATGLAIKFGMGLVNKIKGFEKGGIARANQPAIVGERGPELIMPRKDMQVTPNNKLGTMGGSVNVNFTINAVDTRGFRSLLTNERGTIVNIINQAVTDKGRPVLV